MSVVEDGSVYQVGTYNGNPLGMAATRANLTEVLTPEAYAHLDRLNDRILAGCEEVIRKHNLPGYAVGIGSKGCVTFSTAKIVDYETFKANQDADLSELAWLFNMNRGIFMTPGREEEWTLSVTHDDASIDRYVAVFEEMAERADLLRRSARARARRPRPGRQFHGRRRCARHAARRAPASAVARVRTRAGSARHSARACSRSAGGSGSPARRRRRHSAR